MRTALLILSLLLMNACDRVPTGNATSHPTKPAREHVEISTVAMLPPGRQTHLARGDDGTLWWIQENDDGNDVAFTLAADGVPRAVGLTSANVLAALRMPSPALGASGNVQSLAADHGEGGSGGTSRVWFYFAGGTGRQVAACVGIFDPRDESIRVVLDTKALTKLTGMVASLSLARGTIVVVVGQTSRSAPDHSIWVWVRHSDGSRLVRIDAKTLAASVPFESATTEDGRPLPMSRPGQSISPAAGGLLLLDQDAVVLWKIDATGRATPLHELVGLPSALSTPAGDRAGTAYVFAADGPLIRARSVAEAERPLLDLRYPALLVVESGKLRGFGGDHLVAGEGFATENLRVQQVLPDDHTDALLGYDEHSGALLRFKVNR